MPFFVLVNVDLIMPSTKITAVWIDFNIGFFLSCSTKYYTIVVVRSIGKPKLNLLFFCKVYISV